MASGDLGLIELLLVFGGVLLLALWELRSVRRAQREDARREREQRDEPPQAGR
jgi:hypothetical protein